MRKSISIPIYGQLVEVYIGELALSKAGKIYSCLDVETVKSYEGYAAHFQHNENKQSRFVIYFPNIEASFGTIAHECGHSVMQILSHVGVKVSPKNDEAYIYLLGWLVNQVAEAIKIFSKQKTTRDETPSITKNEK